MKRQALSSKSKHGGFKTTIGLLLVLSVFFMISSCKKAEPEYLPVSDGFEVISHTELDMQDISDQLMIFPDDPNSFDYHDYFDETTQLTSGILPFPIAHDVVKYTSTDNKGAKIQLTGLLIYPYTFTGKVRGPIVSVNHGTQALKRLAPSKWKKAGWKDWRDFPEVVIADVMASLYGWIIIMPDYQGMGDDIGENHPYCVRERLAAATADMVQVAIKATSNNQHQWVKWNGQTFLYGYSEGGFVTMSAARELEARNVNLNGVVCMDGPYDLSGTMLDVMLRDTVFPVPYFLPMLLVGYNTMYPSAFEYGAMLKDPYKTDIPKYTTGFYDTEVIDSKMPPDKIIKKIFTPAFIDSLKNSNSQAQKIIYGNNSYVNWTPKSKMLLWHCINDDCVPFGNFTVAKKRFTELGLTNVDYVVWPAVTLDPSMGTVHVTVAPRAFYEGSRWIYNHTK